MIKAATLDCSGTLLLDGPSRDDHYKQARLAGMERVLAASGLSVSRRDLDRAYLESGRRLGHLWKLRRDMPASGHVTALLR